MKAVIWKIEGDKAVCLLTNGDFRTVPLPKGAQVGSVITFSYNTKIIITALCMFAVLVAFAVGTLLYCTAQTTFIDITYGQKKGSQLVVELAANRWGKVMDERTFSTGDADITGGIRFAGKHAETAYGSLIKAAASGTNRKKAAVFIRIADKNGERAAKMKTGIEHLSGALEKETGKKLQVKIEVYRLE
jgi:hypothetical protein